MNAFNDSVHNSKNIEYNPDKFPGLIYELPNPKLKLLIFSNGKINIIGAKKSEDLDLAMRKVFGELVKYRNHR